MNQNEKLLNEKVSGAYSFRNNLWELVRWAEHNEVFFYQPDLNRDVDLVPLLQGLGDALADMMDGQDVNLIEVVERNFGKVVVYQR